MRQVCCQFRPPTVIKQYGSRLYSHPPLSSHAPATDGWMDVVFDPHSETASLNRFKFARPRLFALSINGREAHETLRCSVGHLSVDIGALVAAVCHQRFTPLAACAARSLPRARVLTTHARGRCTNRELIGSTVNFSAVRLRK
ncbi:hypothetical protein QQF64_030978 [Cirrhinus molitorella]|uniref:Uncharacterized protein n=1 Tax=Cirrhinus molitorella TaxID=172907 RepID=A0ABR3N588_9TELE